MGPVSVSRAIEIERKYAVTDGVALPALERVDGVVTVDRRAGVHLDAVYLDTADRSLLAAGIVVRRRTGGHDSGWHVKLRGPVGRVELHSPIDETDPETVPAEFEAALRTRLRGRPLVPIARIRTERRAVVVVDELGGGVEVVDDLVSATDVAAGRAALLAGVGGGAGGGLRGVLRAARPRRRRPAGRRRDPLREPGEDRAGARPGRHQGPLHRAAAGRPARCWRRSSRATRRSCTAACRRSCSTGTPTGPPCTRCARSCGGLGRCWRSRRSPGPAGDALRDRLGGLGRMLGAVRDPMVGARVAEGLLQHLDADTPGLAEARALLVDEPTARLAADTAALVERLGGPEVLALVADLEAFDPDGPLVGEKPKALVALGERAVRRAGKRAERGIGGDLDTLHRARKATKRARFVVEELVAAGVVPKKSKLARAARKDETAQDVLGDHRDLALVLAGLPAASERLTAAGGNAFAIGRIAERGRRRLASLQRAAERAVRHLD